MSKKNLPWSSLGCCLLHPCDWQQVLAAASPKSSSPSKQQTLTVKFGYWIIYFFRSTDGERQRLSVPMKRRECCSSLVISLLAGGKTHRDTKHHRFSGVATRTPQNYIQHHSNTWSAQMSESQINHYVSAARGSLPISTHSLWTEQKTSSVGAAWRLWGGKENAWIWRCGTGRWRKWNITISKTERGEMKTWINHWQKNDGRKGKQDGEKSAENNNKSILKKKDRREKFEKGCRVESRWKPGRCWFVIMGMGWFIFL